MALDTGTPEPKARGLALPALRAMRERRGLTQEELAHRADLSRTVIAKLESGTSHARPMNALRLAQALGIPLDVLRGCTPLPTPSEEEQEGVLSEYFAAAMRHATYRRVGAKHLYGAILGMPGLWARGYTREEVERELRGALEWWVLTAVFAHRPLPTYDNASLEITAEDVQGERVLYPAAPPSEESFLDVFEQTPPREDA
jgi:transcriptional regulator with XRE-family HTH domain